LAVFQELSDLFQLRLGGKGELFGVQTTIGCALPNKAARRFEVHLRLP
jgi:hypothetical protein